MTTERRYSCDLCGYTLTDFEDGVGIYWADCNQLVGKVFYETEHHLCWDCIKAIKSLPDNSRAK